MDNNEQNETMYFYLKLLAQTVNPEQYPFTKMIIENRLTQKEYDNLMQLIEKLYDQYVSQKEQGYMDFSGLLVHFAGMLNTKLAPDSTIYALKQEGYYTSLMEEFIGILKKNSRL